MDAQAIAALVQIGVAGVMLYAFISDKLRTKAASDERQADAEDRLVELRALYEARIKVGDERLRDQKLLTAEWRALALGTERRLDQVGTVVATAVGAAVPSASSPEART